jgi:hypothetical protein
MNTNPETDLDLEKLFLPAWAQESPSVNRYAKFEGGEGPRQDDRRQRGNRPPPRRDVPAPAGRERPRFGGRDGARPPGREGGREGRRPPRQDRPREDRREPRREPTPLPEINVTFRPEDKGVDSLARQIKMTGRAYPLFDIAQMILLKPDRYWLTFEVEKRPDGQPVQPLFLCALDETLWLSEDEAVAHVLNRHFATFYQSERTATEPPKGTYTFVAQCGLSGVILGPPNHHDYQNQLRKLHGARFSRMPFEEFKFRVKIVRDEAVVKKWVEDQSWRTEYVCLNMPEALRLGNLEEVEKHFRENHLANIIKPVDTCTLTGTASRSLRCPQLARLARLAGDDQRRFPLQIATVLSQQFATRGLQFFKVNKTVTHVSVARPLFLDLEATPVSDGVKRIVQHINSHPKCTRRQLFEALAPTPTPAPVAPAASGSEPVAPAPQAAEPTPEQTAVIADLHWLIHQGHVIEFASGILETAKRPIPRPPKPEQKPAAKSAAPAAAEAVPPTVGAESGASVESVPAEAAPPGATESSPGVEVEEMPGSESAPIGSTESAATVPCVKPETAPDALPDAPGQAPTETPPASPAWGIV